MTIPMLSNIAGHKKIIHSSDEDEVIAKKPKASGVRARRGFSKKNVTKSDSATSLTSTSATSAIYTSCVSRCFNDIKTHTIGEDVKQTISNNNAPDIENDLSCKLSKKQLSKPRVPKLDTVLLLSDDEDENSQNIQNTPKNKNYNNNNNSSHVQSPSPPPPPSPPPYTTTQTTHGRKGPKQKQRKQLLNAVDNLTKNLSDAQDQLRSSLNDFQSPAPELCVIDGSDLLTVRIDYRGTIHRYQMSPEESFSTIITQIASKEHVQEKCIMLVLKDKTLRPTDCPLSINLHTADIINCHVNQNAEDSFNNSLSYDDSDNMIEIVVQSRSRKHKELIKVYPDKPLSLLMADYARRVKKDETCLQFTFDGETVGQGETATMLDMEDGDILDVKEMAITVIK